MFIDFKLSRCDEYWYFGFGVLHGMQVNLVETSEDGTHSGFRNVVY
jgi:hypothetical protein